MEPAYNLTPNSPKRIRLLVADDHATIRVGVKHILSEAFPQLEIAEARTAREVFDTVRASKWDLVILDINLPEKNGLEILYQFGVEEIDVKVLVFSIHTEDQMAIRCLKAGAYGYMSKNAADTELVNAVNQILNKQKYIPPKVANLLAEQFGRVEVNNPHELLSDREYQVLLLIASGMTVSEIAEKINLSVSTINTYRARILKKMNLKNNAAIMNYCIKQGLNNLSV